MKENSLKIVHHNLALLKKCLHREFYLQKYE